MTTPTHRTPRVTHDKQFWKDKVDEWEVSGLSQSAFCQQEGFSIGTFNRWKVIFKGKAPGLVTPKQIAPTFIPVDVEPQLTDLNPMNDGIDVTLPNRLIVKIPLGSSVDKTVALVEALSTARC